MTGGLFKSASRVALVAVAGVLAGSVAAQAADLGGDCCADLEERVAELETTTARKGNRRVSLTISGQVNRTLMYWNDGGRSNTYFGLDNTNSSTRINFAGSARINPTVSAGFNILMEINGGGRTATVNQLGEDETAGTIGGNQDHRIGIRDANWWLESTTLGRVTMGRLTPAGPAGIVDIGGIGVVAPGTSLAGNALLFRDTTGTLTTRSISALWDNGADTNKRVEGIRYSSPNFAGFQFNASIGEAAKVERTAAELAAGGPIGRAIAYNLTYAGEFSGVRIAAAIGQEINKAKEQIGIGATSANPSDGKWTGGSLSLRHVPTGLFAQATYSTLQRTDYTNITTPRVGGEDKAKIFGVQAGISQNWFGIGATSLYGEYFKVTNGIGANVVAAADDTTESKLRVWGLGIVQNIDAAAMELYLGYRNHSATDSTNPQGLKDIDVILAGARIRF